MIIQINQIKQKKPQLKPKTKMEIKKIFEPKNSNQNKQKKIFKSNIQTIQTKTPTTSNFFFSRLFDEPEIQQQCDATPKPKLKFKSKPIFKPAKPTKLSKPNCAKSTLLS